MILFTLDIEIFFYIFLILYSFKLFDQNNNLKEVIDLIIEGEETFFGESIETMEEIYIPRSLL